MSIEEWMIRDMYENDGYVMKCFLFVIVFLLISFISTSAQGVAKVNPVNVGLLLIEQPSVTKMKSICEYYDLSEEPEEDGSEVYSFPDGSKVEFKVEMMGERRYPTVKVFTGESHSSISKKLSDCGYRKVSDGYVKGSKFEHRRTRCRVSGGAKSVLTFTKEYNAIE